MSIAVNIAKYKKDIFEKLFLVHKEVTEEKNNLPQWSFPETTSGESLKWQMNLFQELL